MGNVEKELEKRKIRERYKGISTENLEIISAKEKFDFYDSETPRRVAVYVRVSTDNLQQTSSYELQKNYYENKVLKNKNWTLVDIYADEGISGTSLKHRDEFNRMISDCKSGKIDIIITKSVSRFSRNIVDGIETVRNLASLKEPVGVFFETENLFTLDDKSKMSLNFLISMAEEESHIKSSIMNASIEMRFSHGILLTPVLLGYDHDEGGNLIINEDEAKTVRLIFFMYLFGYSSKQISEKLTELKRKTKKGNLIWSSGTVTEILKNERYCGDVLARKSYTPNYLDHKSRKNKGNRTQYKWYDHHSPIISRDDFIAAQHLLANKKYGNKGILPQLKAINNGEMKGFVQINPRWSGFDENDYRLVSSGVYKENEKITMSRIIELCSGEFDYRQYRVARTQFFNTAKRVCITFSCKDIIFSSACINILNFAICVELYFHPEKYIFAVKESTEENRNSIKWVRTNNNGFRVPRKIGASAYAKTIYSIMNWNVKFKYRARGYCITTQSGESVLFFDMTNSEICISPKNFEESDNYIFYKSGQIITALPKAKFNNIGEFYYSREYFYDLEKNEVSQPAISETVYNNMKDLKITDADKLKENIASIIRDLKKEI